MTPLRWGVIGTGGIAARFTQDLSALPGTRVVAVGSRTRAAAEAFGERHGVPGRHVGLAALVTDPHVDAVYVATPHPAHAEGALAAIVAGKPVLVEKPFTVTAHQAREVVDAARAAGVFCMEAMWTRFLPHMVRIQQLLALGAVGQVRTVVADHGQWFAADARHRLFAPELGGGALLDLGVYPVSLAHQVLGTPRAVVAAGDAAFTGVDAQVTAALQYPGGAHAVVTATLESATPRRAFIAGTEGAIDIEPVWYSNTSFTLTRRDGHRERFEAPPLPAGTKGMFHEAAEVARCVDEGLTESPVIPLAESIAVMATLDDIRRQVDAAARA
jgi:predicted dehydrogenase